jgi:hypothetical protein
MVPFTIKKHHPMRLSLIVLRSTNPEHLADFYRKIGIPMAPERHDSGPLHFAGTLTAGVIEIYPSRDPIKTTFGISVASQAEFTKAWLSAGGSQSASGLLIDPDGNPLYLSSET